MINFLVLLVLCLGMGNPASPMERGDDNPFLCPRQVIFYLNSKGYWTFHDLDQLSQTSKSTYKNIQAYFDEGIPTVVEFFKSFEQTMEAFVLDQEKIWEDKIWALSKKWVAYDTLSQFWILNYAINYLTYSFQTSSRKIVNPGFHEWIYLIRLF